MIDQTLIPKKIHYCWLGGREKPEMIKKCINSWKKYAPDYEIIEWNEKNFPLNECNQYVTEALQQKKWAFVTDYMRLMILYNEGGIYLDTDVELIQPLDSFLNHSSFICQESLMSVCTAVIGSTKKQIWIKEVIDLYDSRRFIDDRGNLDETPNSQFIFNYLVEKYNFKNTTSQKQELVCNLIVYPAEYFSPKNYSTMKMKLTQNTHAIHHYDGGWKSSTKKKRDYILAIITRIIGEKNREYLKHKIKNKNFNNR